MTNNPIATSVPLKINRDVTIRDYVSMLRRRLYLILIVFLSIAASTVFFVLRRPDIYMAFTTVVIEEAKSAFTMAGLTESKRPIGFYQGILNSRSYLKEVLDSIGIDMVSPVLPESQRDTISMLNYIRGHIGLGGSSFESLLKFNARAGTRDLAYLLAHFGTVVLRKKCATVETEQTKQTVVQIEKQLVLIRQKMEQSEVDYQAFRERTGLIGEGLDNDLKHLQDMYFKERGDLTLKRANFDATKKLLEHLEARITPQAKVETKEEKKLRAKLRELEKEKGRLVSLNISISPNSPLQKEINTIENKLIQSRNRDGSSKLPNPNVLGQWQELRTQVASQELEIDFSKKRVESFKISIAKYKKQHPEILEQSLELSRLARTKKLYEETYNILLGKAEEAKIKEASETGGIKIIDPPYKPNRPIPKNAGRFYAAGVFVGLLLGIGLAFFLEFNDTTIKSSDDIERFLNLPVIGTIPHIAIAKNASIDVKRTTSQSRNKRIMTQYPKNLIDFNREESLASEAYRSLRTNLLFSSPDKPIKSLMLTSSGPGEGKSLTVANVAMAYAQMGSKVLLADTDLRRPVVHHLFQTRREPGFCELFLQDAPWDEIVRPTKMKNLSVITAGRFTPNPAELIGAQKMSTILEKLKEQFDIVLFDTPPLVAVTDATVLSTKVDGAVLVVKSHKTEREFAKRAINILTGIGTKIIGVVLNDIDLSHRYSSYGYYKYYYHYYRSQKD